MPYCDPKSITVSRSDQAVTVVSPFWSVVHDLSRGGAIANIRFTNGHDQNILRHPLATHAGDLSDLHSSGTSLKIRRNSAGVQLTFRGHLAGESREKSNIAFETIYRYTPYWIRREITLTCPRTARPRRIDVLSGSFDSSLSAWAAAHDFRTKRGRGEMILGPHYDDDSGMVPQEPGVFFSDNRPTGWIGLYKPGGEGIQIAPAGDLGAWECDDGHFRMERRDGETRVSFELSPSGNLSFATYITLANLPASYRAPLRTVMVGNPPFPDDKTLKLWADNGTQLIVIMEGASWGKLLAVGGPTNTEVTGWSHGTDRFWRTGKYPCYADRADMRDLDRMIRTVHRCDMKIVPYSCPTEVHPEVPTFAAHAREWALNAVPGGGVIYHPAGKSAGGCYGAMVCPDSPGWRRHYLNYIDTLLKHHDFDGVYIDIIRKAPCFNPRHSSHFHGGLDGLWQIMSRVRERLGPDKLMICHNSEKEFHAATNNYADMIVTLEGLAWTKRHRIDMEPVWRVIRAFAATRVSMVPVSTWYRVPADQPKQTGLRDGIAKGLLVGTVPYSYCFWESGWGYRDARAAIDDPRGLYAAFRKLRDLDLDASRFDDCFSSAVRTNRDNVLGARYVKDGRRVIIIANVSEQDVQDVSWNSDELEGTIASLRADEYVFIEHDSAPRRRARRANRVAVAGGA